MTKTARVMEADLFGHPQLRHLAEAEGPCVSLFLPTHRAGPEIQQDPIRLRNLLDTARERLRAHGLPDDRAGELLEPARALVDDVEFWQHQSDGLALFAAPGLHQAFRVPLPLAEDVAVGDTFRIRPLLPLLTGDGRFFLLALSQQQVRLFEGTRTTLAELDIGDTPGSMAEALAFEDHETELQYRSGGRTGDNDTAMFHGHGAGGEVEKDALERYFRAVDDGLWSLLSQHDRPMVLACVSYYVPMFRTISRHRHVLAQPVEGNPEDRNPADLHAAAWEIVAPVFREAVEEALGRTADALGTGLTATDADQAATAAGEGRIDTLIIPEESGAPPGSDAGGAAGDGAGGVDTLDRTVVDTLLTGGTVFAVPPDDLPGGGPVAALLRY